MKLPTFSGLLKKPKPALIIRRVVGESMLPTLLPGRVVVATGWHSGLLKEDVVVISHQGVEKIKRIHRITDGRIFVLGDNPLRSTDSHIFGWLDASTVVGKVVWPRV